MSDGGLTVIDGSQLRSVTLPLTLPDPEGAVVTGADVLDLVETRASSSIYGLSLPQTLKSSALKRVTASGDDVTVRSQRLERDQASELATNYLTAIADELREDPLVVSVLDGKALRLFLEDEDDFAMLAENLFTDLDIEDKGKLSRGEIGNALVHMGVDMGIPPFSDFPVVNDILKKHGAEGDEELGQARFADILQLVLQDVADALAGNHVVAIQNIKFVSSFKLRKLLADEKQLNDFAAKILQENNSTESNQASAVLIRGFLEKHGKDIGLPPPKTNESVAVLYGAVFEGIEGTKPVSEFAEEEFRELVKIILEKFAEQLEANSLFYESE